MRIISFAAVALLGLASQVHAEIMATFPINTEQDQVLTRTKETDQGTVVEFQQADGSFKQAVFKEVSAQDQDAKLIASPDLSSDKCGQGGCVEEAQWGGWGGYHDHGGWGGWHHHHGWGGGDMYMGFHHYHRFGGWHGDDGYDYHHFHRGWHGGDWHPHRWWWWHHRHDQGY